MTRSIYGAIFIGVLAAACGGGNGDSHACGDGIVNGSEQCDDGNVISGDGCSSSCQTETPSTCGDGVLDVATEGCDDGNTVDGDGCDSHCRVEAGATCGNGTIETGETCDDGNHASADGCSATCQVESGYTCTGTPSVCTMGGNVTGGTCAMPFIVTMTNGMGSGSGDTTNATNQIPAGNCDQYGTSGDGNDQIFSFTLTATADVDIELAAPFDANIRVMRTACDTSTQVSDHLFHDGCADQGFEGDGESLTAQSLPAGTYYLSVDGYDDSEFGAYTFTITTSASTAVCGNGIYDDNEECDDGGVVAGDRCSATCTLEFDTAEVEPNDDAAHAQLITPTHHIIKGSILPTGDDVDLYTFTLTTPATVQFETYDAIDAAAAYNGFGTLTTTDCKDDTTYLVLFDSTGDVTDDTTMLYDDIFDGGYDDVNFIGQCSYIGPNDSDGDTTQGVLPAGTYTIKVEDINAQSERAYILDIKFSTDP
jgi:cysteine-rich repeat protein